MPLYRTILSNEDPDVMKQDSVIMLYPEEPTYLIYSDLLMLIVELLRSLSLIKRDRRFY
jgi:hypothetical protein